MLRAGQPAADLAAAPEDGPPAARLHPLAEPAALLMLMAEYFTARDTHGLAISENARRKRRG